MYKNEGARNKKSILESNNVLFRVKLFLVCYSVILQNNKFDVTACLEEKHIASSEKGDKGEKKKKKKKKG